jgi:hypothetical protein
MPRRRQNGTAVTLSEAGSSRVNGYLFVLGRSLATFLPRDSVRDIVREIDSHLRDRIAVTEPLPDERAALERILSELGPPLRVAQAYSIERTVDEAVVSGRFWTIAGAILHVAMSTVSGFFAGFALFCGYTLGTAFVMIAALKPIFPNNVGFWVDDRPEYAGFPWRLAGEFPAPLHEHVVGGYWVIPFALVCGLGLLSVTHWCARRFLGWWRARRPSFTVSVRPAL